MQQQGCQCLIYGDQIHQLVIKTVIQTTEQFDNKNRRAVFKGGDKEFKALKKKHLNGARNVF